LVFVSHFVFRISLMRHVASRRLFLVVALVAILLFLPALASGNGSAPGLAKISAMRSAAEKGKKIPTFRLARPARTVRPEARSASGSKNRPRPAARNAAWFW
jgi:hypothetical protein